MHSLLIVNADDFGISQGVNQGIVEAHLKGILTSTTAMANMPAFDHAVQLKREHPTLAVGVHLNLTAGTPVLPSEKVPDLIDRTGRFLRVDRLLLGLTLGRIDLRQVEAELSAQVERAIRAGLDPGHLDSHHHVHCHPALHSVAVRLAQRYEISGMRCPVELRFALRPPSASFRNSDTESVIPAEAGIHRSSEMLDSRFRGNDDITARVAGDKPPPYGGASRNGTPKRSRVVAYLKTVVLSGLGRMLRLRARRAGLSTPDHFLGLALGLGFSAAGLQEALRQLPEGTTELMCHPGHPDEELAATTSYAAGRDSELAALLDPNVRRLLDRSGVRLGGYSDLSR